MRSTEEGKATPALNSRTESEDALAPFVDLLPQLGGLTEEESAVFLLLIEQIEVMQSLHGPAVAQAAAHRIADILTR